MRIVLSTSDELSKGSDGSVTPVVEALADLVRPPPRPVERVDRRLKARVVEPACGRVHQTALEKDPGRLEVLVREIFHPHRTSSFLSCPTRKDVDRLQRWGTLA